jgi:thioredoxin 1
MIAPILDEIAGEYADRVKICKLNVDENQNTPPKYGIRGIPTLMLFRNGNVEATKVGALSKSQLTAFLDSSSALKLPRRRPPEGRRRFAAVLA